MGAESTSRRAERHRALWEQRDARLAKLVFATLLFGALATWKVTSPSLDHAREHARVTQALEDERRELALLEPKQAELQTVVAALEQARRAIEVEAPWNAAVQTLQRGFANLREADERRRLDPLATRHYFLEEQSRDDERAASREPAPWEQVGPSTLQAPNIMNRPASSLDRLEELPDERVGDAGWKRPFAALSIESDAVRNASDAQFEQLFAQAIDRSASDLLAQVVDSIVQQVREGVVAPLAAALTSSSNVAAELASVRTALDELETILDEWRREHLAQRDWLETVARKRSEVAALDTVLAAWRARFADGLGTVVGMVSAQVAGATARVDELASRRSGLADRQRELEHSVADLLPAWVRGFVSTAELVRFQPLVLGVLAALIVSGAALVRHHHRRCRDILFPERAAQCDPAVSSCWTLVDRGSFGTLMSSLCWIAVAGAWWWITYQAWRDASAAWDDDFFGPAPLSRAWLALPVAALVAMPMALMVGLVAAWRDRRRV